MGEEAIETEMRQAAWVDRAVRAQEPSAKTMGPTGTDVL